MKSKNNNSLTKKFFIKTIYTILIFTIIYIIILILLYNLFSIKTWKTTDFIYIIIDYLRNFIFPFWLIGIIIIIIHFWNKTFKYINEITYETSKILNNDNKFIKLPSELSQIENSVNHIKKESIKNKELAIQEQKKKNELITYLAHDLKTPLTSIIGYLDLILANNNLEKKDIIKYTTIAMEKSLSLQNLINELFEITKLDTLEIKKEFQKIDLMLLLNQIICDFYPLATKSKKKITLKSKHKHLYVLGNSKELFRAFNNLLKNAINYSSENSNIEITTSLTNKHINIKISNSCNKNLSTKELNKIFDKFYRGDTSRNTETGGSGLGLAITKQIINLHNGTIRATSNQNYITFIINFPILSKS